MRDLRMMRGIAALGVGLVLLLLIELPALAYPRAAVIDGGAISAISAATASATAGRHVGCNPIQLRRAARWRTLSATDSPAAADDVGRWQPTLSEGAVFTAIGSGMLLGGGIVLGVGMAQLIPIVTDAAGLVTAAMNPLLAMGLGLTLLITGIALLVHGVEVLKAVRAMEEQGVPTAWNDPARETWGAWSGSRAAGPRTTVLLRF